MKKSVFTLVTIAIMVSTNLFAQITSDINGSKDFPLVSRFKNSHIAWYQVKNFDKYFMLSLKDNNLDRYEINGKITRIQYESQKEHSVFEIYKSYEVALKNAGFEILLTLDKTNCGINLSEQLYNSEFHGLNALTDRNSIGNNFRDDQYTYLSAKKHIEGKDIYVIIYVTVYETPLITFDAIEVQSMDEGLVSVKDLNENLSKKGHIAIYDILFNSNTSSIKKESAEALKNIAEYLSNNKDEKYIIVGHTDNTGKFDLNIELSKKRADSVKNELVNKYNVEAEQLKTYGVGSTSPITTNLTKEGKAKNRRVEIVLQ